MPKNKWKQNFERTKKDKGGKIRSLKIKFNAKIYEYRLIITMLLNAVPQKDEIHVPWIAEQIFEITYIISNFYLLESLKVYFKL